MMYEVMYEAVHRCWKATPDRAARMGLPATSDATQER